jgi:UMF1 family MFS transporter
MFMLWGLGAARPGDWPFVPRPRCSAWSQADHEPSRDRPARWRRRSCCWARSRSSCGPRDAARTGVSLLDGEHGAGIVLMRDTFGNLKGHADVATFLGARMLYCDGMTALLIFGGLFAAGLMKWGALEMLAYGISLRSSGCWAG